MNRGLLWIVTVMLATSGLCCAGQGQLIAPASGNAAPGNAAQNFRGWEGVRVIEQMGWPGVMRAADLDGDGREELIVVNTRQSRLDVYRWLPPEARKPVTPTADDRPNDLPMADDFQCVEVPQDRLPRDVLAMDVDGDGKMELVVLQTPPNRIAVYRRDDKGQWDKGQTWDLLPGNLAGRDALMQPVGNKQPVTLLVSMGDGIQQVTLSEGSRAKWLEPRGRGGRVDWWSADLDGDGDMDIVEWNRAEKQPVRWYENVNGRLMPAVGLNDEQVDDVQVLTDGRQAELLLLGGVQSGILRRYHMTDAKPTPLGRHMPLPLTGADKAAWTGITLDGKPALLTVDANQPRLMVTMLTDNGWTEGDSYPIVSNVQGLATIGATTESLPASQADGKSSALLLWSKDAGDLLVSRWENGRFTYPKPWTLSPDVEDRKILALSNVGPLVWWVQKVGKDLRLYVTPGDGGKLQNTLFTGVGEKADKVTWLGGERLLVQDQYARNPKLVELREGKPVVTEPSHLKKAQIDQFTLIAAKSGVKTAKLADGVLQWLGDDLQPTDQVMLPDGLRLAAYVENADGSAWALQTGGEKMHLLKPDASGVMRLADSYDLDGGINLVRDPVLGLMLIDAQQLVRLSEGKGRELELIETIDSREGRPNGVKEATIHRLFTTRVLAGKDEQLVLADDRRHQLTVLAHQPGEEKLQPVISWPVYEDRAYPYGGGPDEQLTHEPREVIGLDIDGDGVQDLAMLCQDRLLIYLGRDANASKKGGE